MYEDFKQLCDLVSTIDKHYTDMDNEADAFEWRWTTGGRGGGSCWSDGDEGDYYDLDAEDQPDIVSELLPLLKVLKRPAGLTESILFRELRELVDSCLGEDSEHEYYGNWTSYGTCVVGWQKLYNMLVRIGYEI